jgi:Cys-tRNA(Pro) deacylase
MAKTQALRVLESARCNFEVHEYKYVDKGGTRASSAALAVDEHVVIKTLIFEDEMQRPMIVLMHGDAQVSTKALARHCKVKSITACAPATAQKHSGYQVGGTSPFGTRKAMPIYMQISMADLDTIYINAGRRGMLVKLRPADLIEILHPELVELRA